MVPQRQFAGAAMRRVTEQTDFGLGAGLDGAAAGDGEVVLRSQDGFAGRRAGVENQPQGGQQGAGCEKEPATENGRASKAGMLKRLELMTGHVFENLQPAVIGIGDKNFVVAADGNAVGQPEFARARARGAEGEQEAARRIEDLDVIKQGIYDIHMAEGIGGDPLGAAELAGAVAQPADLAHEPAGRIQDLHAAVHGVGDQEAALESAAKWVGN